MGEFMKHEVVTVTRVERSTHNILPRQSNDAAVSRLSGACDLSMQFNQFIDCNILCGMGAGVYQNTRKYRKVAFITLK